MNDLFINRIILDRNMIKNYNEYPFNIDCIKNFNKLDLTKNVTFLIGENGIGKSTFIEALAISQKLNPEGGTQNFNFSTYDTHSNLSDYLHCYGQGKIPKTKFFLRAESFYNVASEINKLEISSYGDLHSCSHGESFIKLIQNRFTESGLYILDEPEAALSPQRQMTLLCLINDLVKRGSQFIISTHSPILISYRDGEILDLDDNFKRINYEDTQIYKMYLDNSLYMQHRLFDD